MDNIIAFPQPRGRIMKSTDQPAPSEIHDQAREVLENLLENHTFSNKGEIYEIDSLEIDTVDPTCLGVKVRFRPLSPVVPLEGKPA